MTLQRWRWSNHFLNTATSLVLNGGADSARCVAAFARHFQEHISIVLSKTKVTYNIHMIWPNSMNCISRMNTHPWSFEEVIPCSCLDEKYKQVKTITKMGVCRNPQCSLPDMTVERKKMLYCTRCRKVNYCSPECQEADWPQHKKRCNKDVEKRASFNSREHS